MWAVVGRFSATSPYSPPVPRAPLLQARSVFLIFTLLSKALLFVIGIDNRLNSMVARCNHIIERLYTSSKHFILLVHIGSLSVDCYTVHTVSYVYFSLHAMSEIAFAEYHLVRMQCDCNFHSGSSHRFNNEKCRYQCILNYMACLVYSNNARTPFSNQ